MSFHGMLDNNKAGDPWKRSCFQISACASLQNDINIDSDAMSSHHKDRVLDLSHMDHSTCNRKRSPVKVAVVGSGMAGLVTAWALNGDKRKRYQVELLESVNDMII